MQTLEQLIALVPDDYDYLIRTGRPGLYPKDQDKAFCHVHQRGAEALIGRGMSGHSVVRWAPTPAEALLECLLELNIANVTRMRECYGDGAIDACTTKDICQRWGCRKQAMRAMQ